MFESILNKIRQQNWDNSPKNISFDFKLMFAYHIAMMVLFGTRVIGNAVDQALLALSLGIVLVILSVVHKVKSRWKWPGLGIFSLPSALLSIVLIYAFFAFAAYTMNPGIEVPDLNKSNYISMIVESWSVIIKAASVPVFTPWYLAGIGIGIFSLLSSLNLAVSKKTEFEDQCVNS